MSTFIATVAAGLEDVAEPELRAFGLENADGLPGAIVFDGPYFPSVDAYGLLRHLNTWVLGIDRVGVLLAHGRVGGVDDCRAMAREINYRELIDPRQSFAVRASRRGEHDFGSMDVARAVGEAVIDAFGDQTGQRLAVSLDDPDVIIRAEVIDGSFRLWLDATGDAPLYRREYRRQLHPASLRATLAHLLLRLADWRGEPLLDPMCGIGTIPIEAALYARGVAPGTLRRVPYALDRLAGRSVAAASPAGVDFAVPSPLLAPNATLDVLGIERYDGHVQGARLNLAAAGAPGGISVAKGDARVLDHHVAAGHFRLAVLNPPFGRRVGSTGIVADLYRRFASAASRSGIDRIVSLAESKDLMSGALDSGGYQVVGVRRVLYGDLPAHVIIAERRSSGA